MNKNKKKGFTLVELLAVIVILAIILIIAVPKIMETIKNAKIGSMESSAKLVASSIEKEYSVSLANGEEGTLSKSGSCLDSKFVDIDLSEYESCTYTIDDNGKAKVTLKGKDSGKFSGLTCTDATKVSASCSDEDSKVASMESSAKLVASAVEKEYSASLSLGEEGTLSKSGSCLDSKFVDIDLSEYESCTYTIDDNGKAKVTLKGKDSGKFSGLTCTDTTKTSASCSSSTIESYITFNVVLFEDEAFIDSCTDEPLFGCNGLIFEVSSEYADLSFEEIINDHSDGVITIDENECNYKEFTDTKTNTKFKLVIVDDLLFIYTDSLNLFLITTTETSLSNINASAFIDAYTKPIKNLNLKTATGL